MQSDWGSAWDSEIESDGRRPDRYYNNPPEEDLDLGDAEEDDLYYDESDSPKSDGGATSDDSNDGN